MTFKEAFDAAIEQHKKSPKDYYTIECNFESYKVTFNLARGVAEKACLSEANRQEVFSIINEHLEKQYSALHEPGKMVSYTGDWPRTIDKN